MTKLEYIENVRNCSVMNDRVMALEKLYGCKLGEELAKVISYAGTIDFFDEERRAFSFEEILNADEKYGVAFAERKLIPVIDAYDNDYIVYSFEKNQWAKVNLSDLVLFKIRDSFEKVL